MTRRLKRDFTDAFKHQIVQLYNSGKPRSEIAREYDLTPFALNNWIRRIRAISNKPLQRGSVKNFAHLL